MPIIPFNPAGGSGSGSADLGDYEIAENASGQLEVTKKGTPTAKLSPDGSWFNSSVTTGVGSLHLGDIHSIGSANENVIFVNDISDVAWFPAWQGVSKNGETVTNPVAISFGALTWLELAGQVGTGIVDYNTTLAISYDLAFFKIEIMPAENYSGQLVWTAKRTPSGEEVSSFMTLVDLQADVRHTVLFEYPLFAKFGQQFSVSLRKGYDGEFLKVRNGTTSPLSPYRRSFFRQTYNQSFTNSIGDVKESFVVADHDGWVLLNGRATTSLTPTQKANALTAGFSTTLPDARGRYRIGATAGIVVGTTGGSLKLSRSNLPNFTLSGLTTQGGTHSHTITVDAGGAHNHSGSTSSDGSHYHNSTMPYNTTGNPDAALDTESADNVGRRYWRGTPYSSAATSSSGTHSHTFTTSTASAHTHTASSSDSGSHNHSLSTESINGAVAQTDYLPPYIAVNVFIYLGY